MRALGIPLGYMQLDSWWYLKTSTGPMVIAMPM